MDRYNRWIQMLKNYSLSLPINSDLFFRHRPRRAKQQRKFERAYTPSRRK